MTSPPASPPPPAAVDDWDELWERLSDAAEGNPAQQYRRRITLFLLGRRGAPQRLLDIGSGTGALLADAHRRWPDARLAGVDLSPAVVARAQRRVPDARIRACDLIADPTPQTGEASWATHAACSEVLEHVDDPVALLRNASAWLAPGCRVVITVPGGPMSAYDRHIGHRRHFAAGALDEVMREAGLDVALLARAGFPFFNLYRGLVIARGERLVHDASVQPAETGQSWLMRLAMGTFRPLLPLSLPRSPLGWQTIGVGRVPGPAAASG